MITLEIAESIFMLTRKYPVQNILQGGSFLLRKLAA